MMISTAEYKESRATLFHRITGAIDTAEVRIGIEELIGKLDQAVQKFGSINLLIDAQGVRFTSLIAHKTWSQGLQNSPGLKEKIRYCAFVIDDSANGRAEKEFMDSERLQFFFSFEEAVSWMRNRVS